MCQSVSPALVSRCGRTLHEADISINKEQMKRVSELKGYGSQGIWCFKDFAVAGLCRLFEPSVWVTDSALTSIMCPLREAL